MPRSPFYARYADEPFSGWPVMDKASWMAAFDTINTAGARLDEALAVAEAAERTRDFRPTLRGVTVGLSTGTSGRRGVFLVSPSERRRWAGAMLAKLLPQAPLKARRVAFFLRANSGLYSEVERSRLIRFRFFDLLQPLEASARELAAYRPHLIVAPASVLRLLARMKAAGALAAAPERLVSVAETLELDDRAVITAAFGAPLSEVYQATEGLLAVTCERGSLHLNEPFIMVERADVDAASRRFAPIITDLTRRTQLVVRYRLDDVLVSADQPCSCGRASAVIARIEGRCDDVCSFLSAEPSRIVRVFPDFISRAILAAHASIADFRAVQEAPGQLRLHLWSDDAAAAEASTVTALSDLAMALGARPPAVVFTPQPPPQDGKRRRVSVRS